MKDMIERFELDTEDHELQVIVESDNHRIMKFAKPGTSCYSVSVMQTSGKICFTGDMGEFVFTNHDADMLAWFHDNMGLSYISEKCRAGDKSEYREDMAKEAIKCQVTDFCADYIDDYIEHKYRDQDLDAYDVDEEQKEQDTWESVLYNQALRNINFENEYTFYQSVSDLKLTITPLLDFTIDIGDGLPCKDFTYRFKWCVLAMNKIAYLYFNKKASMK